METIVQNLETKSSENSAANRLLHKMTLVIVTSLPSMETGLSEFVAHG